MYSGGAISGEWDVVNATLDVIASTTATGTINVRGHSSLVENAAPGVTLRVQGNDFDGSAVLTTAAGALNAGTIDLQSMPRRESPTW
jgi:hypothetical protein